MGMGIGNEQMISDEFREKLENNKTTMRKIELRLIRFAQELIWRRNTGMARRVLQLIREEKHSALFFAFGAGTVCECVYIRGQSKKVRPGLFIC